MPFVRSTLALGKLPLSCKPYQNDSVQLSVLQCLSSPYTLPITLGPPAPVRRLPAADSRPHATQHSAPPITHHPRPPYGHAPYPTQGRAGRPAAPGLPLQGRQRLRGHGAAALGARQGGGAAVCVPAGPCLGTDGWVAGWLGAWMEVCVDVGVHGFLGVQWGAQDSARLGGSPGGSPGEGSLCVGSCGITLPLSYRSQVPCHVELRNKQRGAVLQQLLHLSSVFQLVIYRPVPHRPQSCLTTTAAQCWSCSCSWSSSRRRRCWPPYGTACGSTWWGSGAGTGRGGGGLPSPVGYWGEGCWHHRRDTGVALRGIWDCMLRMEWC